ncbi:MAG: glycosyltransferase [Bacteroidota bacterium]
MKLVILTSRFPYPLEKGDKLRIYHQIRELSQRHEIVLCSLFEERVDETAMREMQQYCQRIELFPLSKIGLPFRLLRALGSELPLMAAWFYRSAIKRKIHQIITEEKADHLYCQLLRMAPYVEGYEGPATLDYMDCFSVQIQRQAEASGWGKFIWRWEAKKLAQYESLLADRFAHHSIISEQDRAHLPFPSREKVAILPNGVQVDYFKPMPEYKAAYELVFVGNLGYFPNVRAAVWLVNEIMPLIWAKRPEAKLLLAGARPTKEIQRLGEDPRIKVSGWLADIREAYAQGQIFIAPLKTGSGQQNKILEALSMARPCVTTTLVNNAIGATAGEEIRLGDSSEELAEAVLDLLAQPEQATQMGESGRQKILSIFSWARSVEALECLWEPKEKE